MSDTITQVPNKPRKTAKVPAPAVEQVAQISEAVSSPAVSRDVVQAPAMPAQEEIQTMATTIETPSIEKAQAIFTDMSGRIKAAFEKSAKAGEELVELTKGNAEAVVASAKIAAKGGEALGQDAAEYSKKSFESAVALFKSFSQVRSPSDYFQLQSDYAKSSMESAVAEASKVSESLLKLAGEVSQPLSNRYAVAAEKLKAVAI